MGCLCVEYLPAVNRMVPGPALHSPWDDHDVGVYLHTRAIQHIRAGNNGNHNDVWGAPSPHVILVVRCEHANCRPLVIACLVERPVRGAVRGGIVEKLAELIGSCKAM